MASYNIEGKTFIITGGAGGLGSVTVKAFIENGAKHVAILDLVENHELKKEICSKYGEDKVKFHKCDVCNPDDVDRAFEKVVAEHGSVDTVMNYAGIANDEDYAKEIKLNLTALISLTKKSIEHMRVDKGGKGGTIINIASSGALDTCLSNHNVPVYCGTKRAVLHFSNCLASQMTWDKTRVRIMSICFGLTDTSLVTKVQMKFFTDYLKEKFDSEIDHLISQSPEQAIKTVVAAYKCGAHGSTWLSNDNKEPQDITENIKRGYAIMSSFN